MRSNYPDGLFPCHTGLLQGGIRVDVSAEGLAASGAPFGNRSQVELSELRNLSGTFQRLCAVGSYDQAELLLAQHFADLVDHATPDTLRTLTCMPLAVLGPYPLLLGARFLTALRDTATPTSWLERNYDHFMAVLQSGWSRLSGFQALTQVGVPTSIHLAMGDGPSAFDYATQLVLQLEQRHEPTYDVIRKSIPVAHGLVGQAFVSALQGEMRSTRLLTQDCIGLQDNINTQISAGAISIDIALAYLALEDTNDTALQKQTQLHVPELLGFDIWPHIAMITALTDLRLRGPLIAQANLNELLSRGATRPAMVAPLHGLLHSLQARLLTLAGTPQQAQELLASLDSEMPSVVLAHAHLALWTGDLSRASDLARHAEAIIIESCPCAHRLRVEALGYGALTAL